MDQPDRADRTPLFVCQLNRRGQTGPVTPWITMANWTAAAARAHGSAQLATSDGLLEASEALRLASTSAAPSDRQRPSWRAKVPEPVVTLAKDLLRVRSNRQFSAELERTCTTAPSYVVGLHGLLWDATLRHGKRFGSPVALIVDACQVEEAQSWGIQRRGYARLAERFGERPQLRSADLVVAISDEVASQVERCAERTSGVIVVPNGVDAGSFRPGPRPTELAARLGIGPTDFVVGWTGSFRSFHGLPALVAACAEAGIEDLKLLLVGDGIGRRAVEDAATAAGVDAIFPGTVAYSDVPEYLRCMDVAVVLAASDDFHYSPVKLREYQAVGLTVIASDVGEMGRMLRDSAILVPPEDVGALARAVGRVATDAALRAELAAGALVTSRAVGSWDSGLAEIERALGLVRRVGA